MLTILMGRARSGKSDAVLHRIAERGDASRQILLVPEHASHAAEVDLCRACGDTASRHAEVLSFHRLATRVLSLTGGLADVTLDHGGKILTLQKALCEVAPMLKLYRRPSRKAAFLESMLSLFDEFSCYQITPELLEEMAEEVRGATREKLQDLSLLYGAYQARLYRPGYDARDRLEKLCDHLEESGFADGTECFVDGFTYFNAQEQRVLSILLRRADSVTVTLLGEPHEGRGELFTASYRTRDQLLRLAREAGCGSEIVYLAPKEEPSALRHLERYFLGGNARWDGKTDAIRLRESADLYAEAEETAAEIRRLVAAGKCRYRDIGVGARNMSDYAAILENVFERYEIPVYQSRRSDILQTPALALVMGALDTVNGNYEYEELFRYLKTGLAGLSPAECDRLENYVLTWEIHGSLWTRDADWVAHPDGFSGEWDEESERELQEINALRQRVRTPLLHLAEGLKLSDSAARKVEALYGFLEEIGLQKTLEEQMRRLAEAGELQRAEETGQLWEILCGVLDQFVEILGEETLSAEEFQRLLRQVLTQYSIGTIPVALDQVTVSEITRNDRHSCRYYFLLGANDHVLPAAGNAGGILNEDDRDELTSRGVRLAPRGMEQMSIELQNLYAALAQPTEGLTVSYPAADLAGAELRPAFLIDRIRKLFPAVSVERSGMDRAYRLTAETPALEAAGEDRGGTLWNYFVKRRGDAIAAMERAADMDRGRLSRPAVRALYGDRFYASASRVERMNTCHFAYFMEYGLRARSRETADFDAPQIGTFLHFLLESVTREVMKRGGFREVSDEELRELTAHFIEVYTEEKYRNFRDRSPRFQYLFRRLRNAAYAVVQETAEEMRHSDFVPLEFELSFGDHGTLPGISIREADSELRVTGKVDRVDGWLKDGKLYLRVVDYKTGHKRFEPSEVLMGLDIQMLLYLFTLQKEGEEHFGAEIEPAGVLYLPARDEVLTAERNVTPEKLNELRAKNLLRSGLLLDQREVLQAMEHEALTEPKYLPLRINKNGDVTEGVASAAQLGHLGRYIERLLHQITREVRDGNIDADPCCHSEDDSACRYCQWAAACHFEDGRGNDHLNYIRPVKREEFWQELEREEEGGGSNG